MIIVGAACHRVTGAVVAACHGAIGHSAAEGEGCASGHAPAGTLDLLLKLMLVVLMLFMHTSGNYYFCLFIKLEAKWK